MLTEFAKEGKELSVMIKIKSTGSLGKTFANFTAGLRSEISFSSLSSYSLKDMGEIDGGWVKLTFDYVAGAKYICITYNGSSNSWNNFALYFDDMQVNEQQT